MLAYAAQGLPHEHGSTSGSQIREFLRKCEQALDGLADAAGRAVRSTGTVEEPAPYDGVRGAFSITTREMPGPPSGSCSRSPRLDRQLVDNLNASSHLRAVLTDLFLLDEALKR